MMPAIAKRLSRLPSKLRRFWAASRLRERYATEDPGSPPSDVPLEVLIPVIEKDLATLPLCIQSIRQFVRHPVRRVHLVTNPNPAMRAAAGRLGVDLVDENEVLSEEARNLQYQVFGRDRSGWIKQQLIKLAGDRLVSTDRFLVVDADTAFVRNIVFCRDGSDVLFCGDSYYRRYYDAYRELTGIEERYGLTFVAHHMLFNVRHLRDLREAIESHTGRRWDQSILGILDDTDQSCFSEYEMYGNFCYWRRSAQVSVRYWNNKSITGKGGIPALDTLVAKFGRRFFTVSCHSYSRAVDA